MGASCIITLGGDGTNRAVAKTCGDTPLLPISTGTNNVFPFMVEGTLAGMAAGVVATEIAPPDLLTKRSPRLEVVDGGRVIDIALRVDAPGNRRIYPETTLDDRAMLLDGKADTVALFATG